MRTGHPIPANVTEKLPACSQCGAKPSGGPAPRRVNIEAMGKPWKVHLVCMTCGGFHEGRTFDDTLNYWLDRRPVKSSYETEQAKIDALRTAHMRAVGVIPGKEES